MVLFVVLQLIFSMFFEWITGNINLYPAYTWRIFHTQPDKYLVNREIYIHQIDNKIFNPPQRGSIFIEKMFPRIRIYEFTKKVQDYAGDKEARKNVVLEFDRLFTLDHPHDVVVWEIREQLFNPIDFFWKNELIDEKFLGKHESNQ